MFLEEMDMHELTLEQVEELCSIAEKRAREYVLSRIPSREISALNISVDAEGLKPISVDIDVDIKSSDLT